MENENKKGAGILILFGGLIAIAAVALNSKKTEAEPPPPPPPPRLLVGITVSPSTKSY